MEDISVEMIGIVAEGLGTFCNRFVFVGGATVALHLTDPTAPSPSKTDDVDCIVEVLKNDYEIEKKLRGMGFELQEEMIGRYRYKTIMVDVMPTKRTTLSPANRWYAEAFKHAVDVTLSSGIHIKVISAPYFIATKIEAFLSRGNNDFRASKDIEDIIAVIDGRKELAGEIASHESKQLKDFISDQFRRTKDQFFESLSGHILDQNRLPILRERIQQIIDQSITAFD